MNRNPVPPPPFARNVRITTNDATFLARHGVGLTEAAHRLGFPSRSALEKWLDNHNRKALRRQLTTQDWLPTTGKAPMRGVAARHRELTEGTAA